MRVGDDVGEGTGFCQSRQIQKQVGVARAAGLYLRAQSPIPKPPGLEI